MNNFLEYFYNIKVNKIIFNKNYYSFIYQGYIYKLYVVNENININFLVNLNKRLLESTLVSQIVINKENNYISYYNNNRYLLIKIFVNLNKKISLSELCYFDDLLYTKDININWGILWSKKVDYLENLINENGKKYPLIVDSFNYFVGMTENAISYYNNILIPKNYSYYISHKNINFNDSVEAIYNPLNIIFDYKARDIAEYIKNSFFVDSSNIFNELDLLLNKKYLTLIDIKLVIARILYPSFYFNLYENILIDNQDEKILVNIINKLNDYEIYLASIINYFARYYDIEEIAWLKRK